MSNPLFDMLGNNMPGPFKDMTNMMQQFNQFRSMFQGDPKQQVMNLLSNGQMTQDQFNQLQSMATQFQKLMNSK